MTEFEIPFPPSVNHYYRHVGPRVLISREGRLYRSRVVAMLAGTEKLTGSLAVHIEFCPPDRRRRDLDNLLKCTLDTLQHAGVYDDDSQIVKLTVFKNNPMPPAGAALIRIQNYVPKQI